MAKIIISPPKMAMMKISPSFPHGMDAPGPYCPAFSADQTSEYAPDFRSQVDQVDDRCVLGPWSASVAAFMEHIDFSQSCLLVCLTLFMDQWSFT